MISAIVIILVLSAAPYGFTTGSSQVNPFVIQGHRPLVIQGHSPVDLYVTDPSGQRTGCVDGATVNEIPGATFTGCGTEPESVVVSTPVLGTWTVTYVGRGNGGSFTITVDSCKVDRDNGRGAKVCAHDRDDMLGAITFTGTATPGQMGSFDFNLQPNGSLSTTTTSTSTSTSTITATVVTVSTTTVTSTSFGSCTSVSTDAPNVASTVVDTTTTVTSTTIQTSTVIVTTCTFS